MTDYSKMTMGELIDARKENNELKSDANKVVKGYEEIEHAIDAATIVQLDSQQSTRAANCLLYTSDAADE